MFVWWGEELINLYNDGYAAFLWSKHPAALAQPASAVWPEIWNEVGPRAEFAMQSDEGTYDESLPFIMLRKGHPEETYVTFSYSRIPDGPDGFGGILCPVTEDTQRIIGQRQTSLLRELAARTSDARSRRDACRYSASAMETDPNDLPFALLYTIEPDGRSAALAAASGIARNTRTTPETPAMDNPDLWPLQEACRQHRACLVSDLTAVSGALPTVRGYSIQEAIALPITSSGEAGTDAVLVVGLNPLRQLDDNYRRFLELVAGGIAAAIANAESYESERRRGEELERRVRERTKELDDANQALHVSENEIAGELEAARRLQEASTHLLGAGDGKALYAQILDAAVAALHADFASIQILHPERGPKGELRLIAHRGFSDSAARSWEWVSPSSTTSCGKTLQTGRREAIADVESCGWIAGSKNLETFRETGIRAMQTTPLLSRAGALLGVLSTHWREPHYLSPSELRSLDVLARMVADLIERSRAEERVRESEEQLRLFVENVNEYALVQTDLEGRVTSWNPGATRLFGYGSPEMVGQSFSQLLTAEDQASGVLEQEISAVGDGARNEEARWLVRRDGTRFWARWVTEPVRDKADRLLGFAKILRDETERQRASEVVLQRQKLESVGLLAGGIAHDFNNLLTGIIGNASLILEDMPGDSAKPIRDIISSGERAAELTRQLLAYSGKGQAITRKVDVSEAVNEIVGLVEFSIPKSVQLAISVQKRLPPVLIDPSQLEQVLMNLVINAGEAIGEGDAGKITVATSVADIAASFADELGQEVPPGRYVAIEVQDTGCGIDEESRGKIFDPFYTTKFVGRGLGLAAVAGIIRVQRGAVTLESDPGRGSTFRILLPVFGDAAQEPEGPAALPSRGAILVVDDEPSVREFIATVLRREGYRVLPASDGLEALAMCDRETGALDATVLDVVMPGMGAKEFLPAFRARYPAARILLTSGYSEVEARRLCAAYRGAGFIQKPYTALQLAVAIQKLLEVGV
jgi:PAS domain S-box-containing protein